MKSEIIIDSKFCGPEDSGNGGYVCGMMAQHVGGSVEVTLWRPPPLNQVLLIHTTDGNGISLMDGSHLVAEARSAPLEIAVPAPPSFDVAVEATKSYRGFTHHPLPHCFVCGSEREDGMRIFAGPVKDSEVVASSWIPDSSMFDDNEQIHPEFLWAAMDCPGAFAIDGHQTRLLGRLTGKIDRGVRVGERCVSIGWHISTDGRKSLTGTAVFDESGRLCGAARATWIEVKPAPQSLAGTRRP